MTRIGLVGAGVIGRTHAHTVAATHGFELAGIADPSADGPALAAKHGVRHHLDHRDLLATGDLDAVIVATPNELHVPIGLDVVAAGIPLLIEKPLAATTAQGRELAEAAERSGVPVLVGHHRRYHPATVRAKQLIEAGRLGRIVAVSVTVLMRKDDAYFDVGWRRAPGTGGPFLINLIHEVDLLRHLVGEITSVTAIASSAARHLDVEDGGAIALGFATGASAALVISDAAAAPWSWDLTAGDSARFPVHPVESHRIAGDVASLSLPTLQLWDYEGPREWTTPLRPQRHAAAAGDPYEGQLRHLGDVVTGRSAPLVSAREGLRDLEVVEAVRRSASTGRAVVL